VSAHVDLGSLGAAVGDDRRVMVEHLRTCPACRAALAADDPVALFSLLATTPIPTRILDDVSVHAARRAGLDRGSFGTLVASMPSARLRLAAAVLAGVALVAGATTLRHTPAVTPVDLATREANRARSPRADVDVQPDRAVSQVVDFTVGDTQVVMVYNGDLKL
jgi:hypothetical protein